MTDYRLLLEKTRDWATLADIADLRDAVEALADDNEKLLKSYQIMHGFADERAAERDKLHLALVDAEQRTVQALLDYDEAVKQLAESRARHHPHLSGRNEGDESMTDYEFTVESEALENMLEAEQEEGRVLRNKVRNQDAQIITLQGQVRASYRDRDDALRALAASRARFADSEARRVELEAVIEKARAVNAAYDREAMGSDEVEVLEILESVPSTVLGEHDQEVAARALEAAADHYHADLSLDAELRPVGWANRLRERAAAIRNGEVA